MTADDAIAYIRGKLADWSQFPGRISAQLERADRLAAAASAQNRADLATKARSAAGALSTLGAVVRATTDRLVSFLSDLTGAGEPVQLPGPYRSDYALRHPELFQGFGSHLGASNVAELASRIVGRRAFSQQPLPARPSAVQTIARNVMRRRPAVARMIPTVFRHPGTLPVFRMGGVEVRQLGDAGELGAVPIVLGLVAIAVAGAMAAAYKQLANQAAVLDLVERGILPPAAATGAGAGAPTFGGELGKSAGQLLTWGAIAAGAYLILPRLLAGAGPAARGRAAGGPDPRD